MIDILGLRMHELRILDVFGQSIEYVKKKHQNLKRKMKNSVRHKYVHCFFWKESLRVLYMIEIIELDC